MNCNGACLPALTPDELFNTLEQLMNVMVASSTDPTFNPNPGGAINPAPQTGTERTITLKATPLPGAAHADKLPATPAETVTATVYRQRMIRAVAIMLSESGGVPNARNVNGTASVSPGSIDRGLWQFNNQAWPWITDAEAYGVPESCSLAYYVSGHFASWGPWTGDRGLDNTSSFYKLASQTDANRAGYAVPADDPLTGAAVAAAGGVTSAVSGLADVIPYIGKALSLLTSGAFWSRFGVGALGVLLLGVALVMFTGGGSGLAGKAAALAG